MRGTHPADLAAILTAIPPDDRQLVFEQIDARTAGLTLVELHDEVRDPIIGQPQRATTSPRRSRVSMPTISPTWRRRCLNRCSDAAAALRDSDRSWVIDTSAYPEDTVGRLMRQDVIGLRAEQTVGEVPE